jgi:hypothetical protein
MTLRAACAGSLARLDGTDEFSAGDAPARAAVRLMKTNAGRCPAVENGTIPSAIRYATGFPAWNTAMTPPTQQHRARALVRQG